MTHLSEAAKAVYLITAAMEKLEDGGVHCEDNGSRLNVYQAATIESNFFCVAASCCLLRDANCTRVRGTFSVVVDDLFMKRNKCVRVCRTFSLVKEAIPECKSTQVNFKGYISKSAEKLTAKYS